METDIHIPIATRVKRVLKEVADKFGVELGCADGQQEIEVMPCEVLNFVHEEGVKILLHTSYDSAYQVGLLDELGDPVVVKPPTRGHVMPIVCQSVPRKWWWELKCHAFGVLFRPEKWPETKSMQEPEVCIKRDVRWEIAEPLEDLATYIIAIQLGVRDDEEPLILIETCNKAGGLAGSSNRKDYALIHTTAS